MLVAVRATLFYLLYDHRVQDYNWFTFIKRVDPRVIPASEERRGSVDCGGVKETRGKFE